MAQPDERILVVDDDQPLLRVCAQWLYRRGHEVVAVGTGREGLNLLEQQPFAMALLDIVLPDITGLSILKTIKQQDPDLVVVLMTGYASLDTAVEAMRSGAYDYLRKPFTEEELVALVERGLRQRRDGMESRRQLEELDSANRDLARQIGQADEQLRAVASLGDEADDLQSPRRALEHVADAAAQLTGARDAGIFRRQPDGRVICDAAVGPRAEELRQAELSRESLVQEALAAERPAIRPRLLDDPVTAVGPLALAGFSSAMVLPLPGASPGLLVILDSAGGFSERQAALVRAVGGHAAAALAADSAAPADGSPRPGSDEFVALHDFLGGNS